MTINIPRALLAIFVALVSFIIFFNGSAVSQEIPVEETISTLEPYTQEDPVVLYAKSLVIEQWGFDQWEYYSELLGRESNWNPTAQNPVSTAYGIHQFLDGTWDDVGCIKTSDAMEQLRCGVLYIDQRYDDPQDALRFHDLMNWY